MNNSFSLRFLFILITAAAILAATLSGLSLSDLSFFSVNQIAGVAIACGFVGAILGALWGLHERQRARGLVFGGLVGCVTGIVISPLIFLDQKIGARVFAAQVVGGAILVALGMSAKLEQK